MQTHRFVFILKRSSRGIRHGGLWETNTTTLSNVPSCKMLLSLEESNIIVQPVFRRLCVCRTLVLLPVASASTHQKNRSYTTNIESRSQIFFFLSTSSSTTTTSSLTILFLLTVSSLFLLSFFFINQPHIKDTDFNGTAQNRRKYCRGKLAFQSMS